MNAATILKSKGSGVVTTTANKSVLEIANLLAQHCIGCIVCFPKIPSAGDLATRLSLLCGKQFPVSCRKFPVQVRREFGCNQLTYSQKTELSSRFRG